MIFSALDYWRYRKGSGRYARNVRKNLMGAAFEGGLPERAIELLAPGDVLFVQTLNSFPSWLVMYLTSSSICHVASYLGDRRIIHATFSGVCVEPLEALDDSNTRVLPTKWEHVSPKQREIIAEAMRSYLGVPYGWLPVLLKGWRIINGRDLPYFRWQFAADICVTLLLLDAPFLMGGRAVFTWVAAFYLLLVLFNVALWRVRPLKFSEFTGKPCDMLSMVERAGGTFMFDGYELARQLGRAPEIEKAGGVG